MSTRTKLALFVAASLVLAGLFWTPRLLRSGGEASADGAAPFSGVESEVTASELPVGEPPTRTTGGPPAEGRHPGDANGEVAQRMEVVRLGSIRGVLLTEVGEPLRSIRVISLRWSSPSREVLYPATLPLMTSRRVAETRAAVTDAGSGFRFEELPAGVYQLTAELENGAELTRRAILLDPGEALDLGELRVPVPAVDPMDLVRIRIHAFDHDGPVPGLRVRARTEGQLLGKPDVVNDHSGRAADERGSYTLELLVDSPISIELVDGGGDIVGGTGNDQRYAKGMLHQVWISIGKGHLEITLPQRVELTHGQALQYVVESSLLTNTTVRSATILGGVDVPRRADVEPSPEGCRFRDLPAGNCTVKAMVLQKDARGAWRPSGSCFYGSATVVGGETVTCDLWRG